MAADARSPIVFLDRDGTLIEDVGYIASPEMVRLLPGAGDGIRRLQALAFRVVLVSNQSGIGRGLVDPTAAAAVHARMVEELAREGVALAGAYYCPHAPGDGCGCRKPESGLFQQALRDFPASPRRCIVVGNEPRDVEAGRRAGCRHGILIGGDEDLADGFVVSVPDWAGVVSWVESAWTSVD